MSADTGAGSYLSSGRTSGSPGVRKVRNGDTEVEEVRRMCHKKRLHRGSRRVPKDISGSMGRSMHFREGGVESSWGYLSACLQAPVWSSRVPRTPWHFWAPPWLSLRWWRSRAPRRFLHYVHFMQPSAFQWISHACSGELVRFCPRRPRRSMHFSVGGVESSWGHLSACP